MIHLPAELRTTMLAHAYACHPEESCGLLAGDTQGNLTMAIATTNVLRSSTNYTIEPREQFKAMSYAEQRGWEIVGVFHSHPHTRAYPSPTDLRLAPDPTWIYIVIGLERMDDPAIRAFRMTEGQITEQRIEVGASSPTLVPASPQTNGAIR